MLILENFSKNKQFQSSPFREDENDQKPEKSTWISRSSPIKEGGKVGQRRKFALKIKKKMKIGKIKVN